MLKKIWEIKLVRFGAVGVFNTLFDLTILNILVLIFHFPVLVANLFSATASIVVSYFLNHHIVFRKNEPHELSSFLKFFAITGLSIVLVQNIIIFVMLRLLHHDGSIVAWLQAHTHMSVFTQAFVNLNFSKVFAVLGGMVWNFFFYKLVVFKDKDDVNQFIADA